MRRVWTVLLVIGLIAATMAAPAEAGKKKKKSKKPTVRTIEVRYENPAFGVGGAGGGCSGCPPIAFGPDEAFAVFIIEDDVSPSGYVSLSYDSDGDGVEELGAGPTICGSTAEPVEIEPATSYTAWPWVAGIDCPGSSSFAGTITVLTSSSETALTKAMEKL
ncbi:MAG: hypothetical protein ACR2KQ_10250 [Actinomycetota bacterium]